VSGDAGPVKRAPRVKDGASTQSGGRAGQMQFNWPSDHTGWTLQTQTNALVLASVELGVLAAFQGHEHQMMSPIIRLMAPSFSGWFIRGRTIVEKVRMAMNARRRDTNCVNCRWRTRD